MLTKIKNSLLISTLSTVVLFSFQTHEALAQDGKQVTMAKKSAKIRKTSIPYLLTDGYKIQSLQYLEKSMVFVLQRGPVAFVCETDHNGISKLCVQIQ